MTVPTDTPAPELKLPKPPAWYVARCDDPLGAGEDDDRLIIRGLTKLLDDVLDDHGETESAPEVG
jgi:hypothetical protein